MFVAIIKVYPRLFSIPTQFSVYLLEKNFGDDPLMLSFVHLVSVPNLADVYRIPCHVNHGIAIKEVAADNLKFSILGLQFSSFCSESTVIQFIGYSRRIAAFGKHGKKEFDSVPLLSMRDKYPIFWTVVITERYPTTIPFSTLKVGTHSVAGAFHDDSTLILGKA
ncbi:MAG TPA: hypothetical protein PKO23_10770 [Candidatus Hydrogenedentes bacterium]|nr:hypothetical protein [Candidatus Hydrogenedentota bacterium]